MVKINHGEQQSLDMPNWLKHRADQHNLGLTRIPSFQCKACALQGTGFAYSCNFCQLYYHTNCLKLPEFTRHVDHPCPLKLEFSPPYGNPKIFGCNGCGKRGYDHWLYRCNTCEYDLHLACVTSVPEPQSQPQNLNQLVHHSGYQNQTSQHSIPISAVPANNMVLMSTRTTVATEPTNLMYMNRGTGMNANQPGNYGYNQQAVLMQPNGMVMGVPQGGPMMGSRSGLGQSAFGNGVMGVVVAGVVTGIAEGSGQEIVQGVVGGFDDGSGRQYLSA
ncbi:DC1 [Dillenia turbinata]|uniref:DC1 n=1 Tax=Dillenia turbinata TaxID=194707 RepID=A0AAN8W5E0_9MAGN